MRGMRTAGQDFSTDFGEVKASGTELPLARIQTSTLEKKATYFDIYDLRVTCETRAGISDVNYSAVINLLHDAGVRYREERRYNIQPDRVLMEILIQKEGIPAINDLNKEWGDKGYSFTFNDNLPEDIQDRIITTPEKELDVKVTEKSASKKTAAVPDKYLSGEDNWDFYGTLFGTPYCEGHLLIGQSQANDGKVIVPDGTVFQFVYGVESTDKPPYLEKVGEVDAKEAKSAIRTSKAKDEMVALGDEQWFAVDATIYSPITNDNVYYWEF